MILPAPVLSPDAVPHADSVLAAKGHTFHWARHLLGSKHAARATRLYRLCRYIDDVADEATSKAAALAKLAELTKDIARGTSADAVLRDGLALVQECQINPLVLQELIDGVASDLETVRIADENELLRYCYRVAGTVGLMMCNVLDAKEPAACAHAVDLGIAMQLTNICRDVSSDARAGRRYIPQSMVGDLPPQALILPAEVLCPAVRRCVATLLDRADVYYRSGELGLPYLPLAARSGILVAARTYQAIGAQLRQRDHAYWVARAVVHKRQKAAITVRALLTIPLRPSFWRRPPLHDDSLHAPLDGLGCFERLATRSHGPQR